MNVNAVATLRRRSSRVTRRVLRALRAEWYAAWRRRPIDPNIVLFESFAGFAATCNPEAIFRTVHRAEDLQHLTSVWALDRHAAAMVRAEFRHDRSVRVVRRGSLQYWRWLATAGTLVNNATFPPEFDRRRGQIYLNTWHGTPLKRMGFDEPDGAAASANTIRNFLQATHLLSQNRYMTDTMYRRAYRLDGLATARVLELGYPRNDRLLLGPAEGNAIRRRLRAARINTDGALVLYAPTWRGASFSKPEDHSAEIAVVARALQAALDDAGVLAQVVVKPHQAVADLARLEPALDGMLVTEDLPVNSLLAVTDVLVSDYSSIAVDFLATGRPIVFAGLGDDDYLVTRGLYVDVDTLPGVRPTGLDSLAREVVRAATQGIAPEVARRYEAMAGDLVGNDDGHASERVVDAVFRSRIDARRPPISLHAARSRPAILIHLGGMRANGITSSALSLLHALAEADMDVTALFPSSNRRAARLLRTRIDPRVRSIQRVGGMNGSKVTQLRRRLADRRRKIDPQRHATDASLRALWDDEWHRCFGDARFDAVVDFSGYSPFWTTLMLHAPEPVVRSIWMHNEMLAEVDRLVAGKPKMRRPLRSVIALYGQVDQVVAVSESLRMHNAATLEHLVGVRTASARNIIDADTVLTGAAEDAATVLAAAGADVDDWTPPPWLDDFRSSDHTWFVCVGRLSPEKNHERLLAAFALVHAERPGCRLLIVGDGYLRPELEQLARRLHLSSAVVFAGTVANPYPFMAHADCVVLSSDHEGQPMVILEAAVLRRPIVSTRFESARDALPGDHILLVERSARALADGMLAALDGKVPPAHLDVESYNHRALTEFLEATLGIPAPVHLQRTGGPVRAAR
jgi:CDP-glycerol glycerophosphotransferase (TagB/SpsB family)/glycosyltransferase involved in cell wall biosynthesis